MPRARSSFFFTACPTFTTGSCQKRAVGKISVSCVYESLLRFFSDDALEVYVSPDKLSEIRTKLIDQGYDITTSEIIRRAKNFQIVEDPSAAKKVLDFLEVLEEQDDVQKVFANVDIPDNVLLEANK